MPGVTRTYQIDKPEKHPEFRYLSFIKRGTSSTKQTLYYLKMKKTPVTAKQISDMFPHFYRKPSDAARVVETLKKHGLVQEVYANCWRISPLGKQACYVLGKRDAVIASQLH
jgi:hypothetical protein